MDKAWKKTTILVGVALVLGLAALATRPSAVRPELFNDQGQEFFPDFKDPLDATSLEVTRFDEKTGEGDLFKVELKEGIWTLPSPIQPMARIIWRRRRVP